METIAFVQGMLSVIGVLMVGGMVWAIKQINDLKESTQIIYQQLDNIHAEFTLRVDKETEELHRALERLESDINSELDSRFDKFTTKWLKG